MVAEVTEELKHNMEVQEVHTVEVLVPMRNLCESPNYGCKYYHMVNSSIGFYSPSWIYIHLDSSPQVVDFSMDGFCNPSWIYICTRVTPCHMLTVLSLFHWVQIQP